jgi:hypothetical protein
MQVPVVVVVDIVVLCQQQSDVRHMFDRCMQFGM